MKVRISDRATADLEEIGRWIARHDPLRAETFVDQLLKRARSLTDHPRRFPEATGAGDGVRKLAWRGYLIFYRAGADAIEIVRIVHGARDWAALFAAN